MPNAKESTDYVNEIEAHYSSASEVLHDLQQAIATSEKRELELVALAFQAEAATLDYCQKAIIKSFEAIAAAKNFDTPTCNKASQATYSKNYDELDFNDLLALLVRIGSK